MRYVLFLILSSIFNDGHSTLTYDSLSWLERMRLSGYVKALMLLNGDSRFSEFDVDYVVHNRLNFRWKPVNGLTAVAEFRNRIFAGERVRKSADFSSLLRYPDEQWNLNVLWMNQKGLVAHTTTERAYVDFDWVQSGLRFGRQRINWGLSTTWNPNDIFNAWNFLDFDYEERAGVDAVSFRYSNSAFSEFSMVYALSANRQDIAALRYFFNRNRFDVQLIGGLYRGKGTLGGGWAGHIGEAGFKGEVQYYFLKDFRSAHVNVTLELDKLVGHGWYISGGGLFNSMGINYPLNNFQEVNLNLSAENLMPGKWSGLFTLKKEINPLTTANLSAVYSPGFNLMILLGGLSYNVVPDFDLDVVWQSYFFETQSKFQAIRHLGVVRLRWSY